MFEKRSIYFRNYMFEQGSTYSRKNTCLRKKHIYLRKKHIFEEANIWKSTCSSKHIYEEEAHNRGISTYLWKKLMFGEAHFWRSAYSRKHIFDKEAHVWKRNIYLRKNTIVKGVSTCLKKHMLEEEALCSRKKHILEEEAHIIRRTTYLRTHIFEWADVQRRTTYFRKKHMYNYLLARSVLPVPGRLDTPRLTTA